ncbi:MAG TPA: anthranilate synthase component I [Legionella sp.]|nr:anthranilate synthase component I [Legionella sp.]
MLKHLSFDEFLGFAKSAKRVAVFREILADRLTPIGIVESLAEEMLDGAILESGRQQEDAGRYSLISFGAHAQLSAQNGVVSQRIGTTITSHQSHPFSVLRQMMAELTCVGQPDRMDFVSGAIGFLTYDGVRLFESIPDRHVPANPLPDLFVNFYQTTLMFDHHQHTLLISLVVEIGDNPSADYLLAQEKINQLIAKITRATGVEPTPAQCHSETPVEVDVSDVEFSQLVARAKDYIIAGDAFQIVLSRCFKKKHLATPFDIYRALRRVSPAPYMFYLPYNDSIILGASPEKLIRVHDREVSINPIAGTRQRMNKTAIESQRIRDELLSDEKEQAEHMMLVDLARNDLGAVCKPGSIQIKALLNIKHFSHVSHITSVITGQLRDDMDAFDALAAAFPAGTLSGAPKIRAMQIIDALETSRRGMYGGAICRFDYQGNLDSCIAIRMAVLQDGVATVRTGAGIVYDSDPQSEANETRQKAQSVLDALDLAEAGLI